MADPNKPTIYQATPTLTGLLAEVEAELMRRDPGAVLRTGGAVAFMLHRPPDLLARLRGSFAQAAREQGIARPVLEVKPGDWVLVGGHPLRISEVTENGGVCTERFDRAGNKVSVAWCDGEGLVPCPEAATMVPPEDPLMATLRDAYDRARRNLLFHRQILERGGRKPAGP